ncbi:N-acetylneuraminate synthase [Desulfuromonas carbonis]|uniref:N-acetylneuraminate synthase n=1 Tax=Desulfuromonas sp. DDH964 TaxID=1823759 RepID=UPI00078BF71D|nr:N-acetylneuraminate synthase [Desulfuromonas sp. DDH964]AMV71854.1 N-acetylneuraminate synthase [Desulfuromonas sp. DDH964]
MKARHTYIIAEAGVNHNGSLEMAKKLVEVAADAGADAVKFQTFKANKLVSSLAPKAEYQTRTTGSDESQFEMIRKLELDDHAHEALIAHCKICNIEFLSTPFDLESVDLLAGRFDLPCIKIPSGEITNAPLLLKIARTGKPVILSTGMSTLGEVEDALGVLAFGFLSKSGPSIAAFRAAYCSAQGQALLLDKVTLLHCTTEYPAPLEDVNLQVMDTLKSAFGLPVGYSDHTEGIAVPIAAVDRGAVVIEKHFTLDRSLPGPDHKASLEPAELRQMVRSIRDVEQALGTGTKHPTPSELKNMAVARKSLVAACTIRSGEPFTAENLAVKRPGNGLSPMHQWELLGRKAGKDFAVDEAIEL